MYDKVKAPSHKINHTNFVEGYLKGFGSRVGVYSNHATIIEAIKAKFNPKDNPSECAELLRRKKLLREIVGGEIDSTKGLAKPKEPWYFTHTESFNVCDDDKTRTEKIFKNSLVANKKPYFFRYLYPELNIKYKAYENAYNQSSLALFNIKFKKLLAKQNKTTEEKALVRKYFLHSPVINSNCIMNILCREFENIDFDIKWSKNNYSALPSYDLDSYNFNQDIKKTFRSLYQKWNNKKSINFIDSVCLADILRPATVISSGPDDDYKEIKFGLIDATRKELQEEYYNLGISTMDALTYIKALAQSYTKFNWGFAWDILGDNILDCIDSKEVLFPVESNDGVEYFGKKYALKAIPRDNNIYTIDEETGEIIFNTTPSDIKNNIDNFELIDLNNDLNIDDMSELEDINDFDINDLISDIDLSDEEE